MMVDVGFIYFASQHLQLVSGLPPMYAGMLLIPGTLAIIIAGLVIARVAVHFHPAQVVSFGLALHAAAFAVLAFLGAHNDLVIILIFICARYRHRYCADHFERPDALQRAAA